MTHLKCSHSTGDTVKNLANSRSTVCRSAEALAVMDGGQGLWQAYFAESDVCTGRDQYKLNRPVIHPVKE